jgi:hypothetical protein
MKSVFLAQHNGEEFSYPEDIVDFIPCQNVPVLLLTSDDCRAANLSSRVKRFKEVSPVKFNFTFFN